MQDKIIIEDRYSQEKHQSYCDSCLESFSGTLNPGPYFGLGSRFWLCDPCYRREYAI